MMFDGTFGGLDKHALVALVSCLVPVDRSNVRQGGGLALSLCPVVCVFNQWRLSCALWGAPTVARSCQPPPKLALARPCRHS